MDRELIHDLRLYLQLIQSSGQLLALTAGPGAREYVDMLMDGAAQMGRLLEDAADGNDEGAFGPTDAVDCLRTLCLRCQSHAGQRGVGLAFEANVSALMLVTDPDRLSRVILNLIMNALRFTPGGRRVTVGLFALGDYVEIAVSDQGPGIAPERLPYIFLRGETDSGAGYGLPSAMACARRLGGELSVESLPGRGSTFKLRLPVRGAMAS